MKKIKRCIVFVFIFVLICTLFSCESGNGKEDYRERDFSCVIVFVEGNSEKQARVTVSTADMGERTIKAELFFPHFLCGITVGVEQGNDYVECGGVRIDTKAFEHILSYVKMLVPEGEWSKVCKTPDGRSYVTVKDADNDERYDIYIDPRSYIPIEISKGEQTVFIKDLVFIGE